MSNAIHLDMRCPACDEPIKASIPLSVTVGDDVAATLSMNARHRPVTPEALGRVAEIVGTTPRPVDAIMAEFGVARRAAQLWVKRARDSGYLQ